MKKVFFGSDHAGYQLKQTLFTTLAPEFPELKFEDCGTDGPASVDYPDYARIVAQKVAASGERGVLVCGSGIGMSIAANKATMAWDATSARLSRQHNDSNVICLGERLLGVEVALEALRTWLKTEFAAGRHSRRIEKIHQIETASSAE